MTNIGIIFNTHNNYFIIENPPFILKQKNGTSIIDHILKILMKDIHTHSDFEGDGVANSLTYKDCNCIVDIERAGKRHAKRG